MDGIGTPNLPLASVIDEVIGNRVLTDGVKDTVRVPVSSLAALIWATRGASYETRALLYADLAWPAGTTAFVYGDATVALRGVYTKSGAAGAGAWTRIGPLPEADLTAVQAAIDAVEASIAAILADAPAGRDTFAEVSALLDGKQASSAKLSALVGLSANGALVHMDGAIGQRALGTGDALHILTRGDGDGRYGGKNTVDTHTNQIAARALITTVDALDTRVDVEADRISAEIQDRAAAITSYGRPGRTPTAYTHSTSGRPEALATVSPSLVANDEYGDVIRLVGAQHLAEWEPVTLEAGKIILLEAAVQRRFNSPIPGGSAGEFAIRWLDKDYNAVGSARILQTISGEAFTVAAGRILLSKRISSAAGTGIDYAWPASVVYGRLYFRTYDDGTTTDVDTLGHLDITREVLGGSPDITSLLGRVSTLESLNAGPRLEVLADALSGVGPFLFSSATGDVDPGPGTLLLSSATQNTSTRLNIDVTDTRGATVGPLLLAMLNSTNPVSKGRLRLTKYDDASKWLSFDVTAVADLVGHLRLTIVPAGASAASPFAAGNVLLPTFVRNGDDVGTQLAAADETFPTPQAVGIDMAYGVTPTLGSGWSAAGNLHTRSTSGSATAVVRAIAGLDAGATYEIEWEITAVTGGGITPQMIGTTNPVGTLVTTVGVHTARLVAPAAATEVRLIGSTNFLGSIKDYVTVRKVAGIGRFGAKKIKSKEERFLLSDFLGGAAEMAKSQPSARNWVGVMLNAFATGEKVELPAGEHYLHDANVDLVGADVPIDVACSINTSIVPGDSLDALNVGSGIAMVKFTNGDLPSLDRMVPFRWDGGTFDTRRLLRLKGGGEGPNPGMIPLQILRYGDVTVRNVRIEGGTTAVTAGSTTDVGNGYIDTGVAVHSYRKVLLENIFCKGANDGVIYLSGDNTASEDLTTFVGTGVTLRNIEAHNCNYLAVAKRQARHTVIENCRAYNGHGLWLSGGGDGFRQHGKDIWMTDCVAIGMLGSVFEATGGQVFAQRNRFENFGKSLDGTAYTGGARRGGFKLLSLVGGHLYANVVRQNGAWASLTGIATAPAAYLLGIDSELDGVTPTYPVACTDVHGRDNESHGVPVDFISVGTGDARNKFEDQYTTGASEAPTVTGATCMLSYRKNSGKLGVNIGALAANAAVTIANIPVVGARPGDRVQVWANPHDANIALERPGVLVNDQVTCFYRNASAATYDPPAHTLNAVVQKVI